MKTSLLMAILMVFLLTGLDSYAQSIPTYPIPSYNILVNGYANFRDNYVTRSNPTKAKQELHVQVRTANGSQNCQATVWIYSLDQTTVFGPYTVTCGQTLTIPIDEREWGVLIESEEDVIVDVWKTTSSQKKPQINSLIQDQSCIIVEQEHINCMAEIQG
jgi:uncharacterized membrane protein